MDVDAKTYTSFQPLAPEETVSAFSLSRLFDFGRRVAASSRFDSSTASSADESATKPEKKVDDPQHQVPQVMVSKSETNLPVVARKEKGKYRNVKTILRRLSAIAIDRRWHQSTGDFKHNFKQYWMPDEHCKECYECGDKFNTFRRRHHCRVCGQIFCRKCCNQVVPGKVMGFTGDIRVCNYCYKIVQAYLNDSLEKSIEALREDMKVYSSADELSSNDQVFSASGSLNSSRSSLSSYYFDGRDLTPRIPRASSSNSLPSALERDIHTRSPTPVRSVFDAFGVTPREANTIKQDYLRDLWREMTNPNSRLELQSHRYRLKTYHNCFVGHELVDWLITYGRANNRAQAVSLGQDLLDNGWIEAVYGTDEAVFRDEYMLYQPGKVALHEMEFNLAFANQVSDSETSSKSTCEDSDYLEESMTTVMEDDDVPIWFRQLSTDTVHTLVENENHVPLTPATSRRFSSGRHLDLDHVDPMESEYTKSGELSLQMKLNHFSEAEKLQVRKELYDQKSKVSLITHVPPPPLDTYVCVEGQAFTSKRKVVKVSSSAHLPDDVLHGVVFPKPGEEPSDLDETFRDDQCEKLAKDRLAVATQLHLHTLLDQLLEKEGLDASWKDVILPVVRKIREQVIPDVRRDDDMDIRQYVWFKKIPGGEKTDCHYISGVTFTKNVAHKKMTCSFQQPKILMLGCGIEYGQRVENKLTSLDPLVLQEYEFLKNFVARLVALKPNLVLVEKSVARIAQDMLLNAGITLVLNIKPSVMERVARCTGADILQSMEQVSRPRLGTCQLFYLHKYPYLNGEHKTLMFFEGCAPDLGCSLVLRGGNLDTLRKVKRIMKFLTYVAYHLKLEARFLLDEFALLPPFDDLKSSCSTSSLSSGDTGKKSRDTQGSDKVSKCDAISSGKSDDVVPLVDSIPSGEPAALFRKSLDSIILSSSPFCRYNLPFLLSEEAKDLSCGMYIPDKIYFSSVLGDVLEVTPPLEEPVKKDAHPNIIMRQPHVFTDPSVVVWLQDPKVRATVADFRAQGGTIDLKMFHDYEEREREKRRETKTRVASLPQDEKNTTDNAELHDSLDEDIIIGRNGGSPDPREKLDCFDVYNHQRIAVLFSSYSSESHNAPKPCISPWAVFMEFYGRNDITLGGFLERYCFRPSYICPSHNCDVPMINHVRYFAHGTGSIYIHMRNLESPIPGYDRTMLTWSWCKQCQQVTPVVPMSFETWSLSFAKYLELRFYGHQYKRRASALPCHHSLHHEHFQYFSFANMVASFKYRQIELFEIIFPDLVVEIGKDREPVEWCEDVRTFCTKAEININMLMDRIAALRIDKSTDPSINASRDLKIKEFMADIKKEYYHFNECIDCLKMKADSLRQAHANTQEADDPHCSDRSDKESLYLEPSEISTLKSDIANMIVKLKRDLCGIVEHWNSKLQEYVHQEKKREKNTRPPSPPKGDSRASFGSSADQTEMAQASSSSRHDKDTASPVPSNGNGGILFQSNHYGTDDSSANLGHEPVSEIFYCNDPSAKEKLAMKTASSPILVGKQSQSVDTGEVASSWKTEEVNKNDNKTMNDSLNDSYSRSFRDLKDDNELLDLCAERVERKDSESFTVIDAKEPTTKTFPDRIDEVTEQGPSSVNATLGSQKMRSTDPEITSSVNRRVQSSTCNSSVIAYQGSFVEDEVYSEEPSQDHAPLTRCFSDSKIFEGANGPTESMRKKTSDGLLMEHRQLDSKQRSEVLPAYLRASVGSLGCSSETDSDHWMAGTKPRTKTVINTLEGCVDADPSFWKGHVDASKRKSSQDNEDALSCCSSMVVEVASEDDISELSSIRGFGDFDDADSCSLSSDDEAEEDEEGEEIVGNEVVRGIQMGESAMDYGLPRSKEKVLKPKRERHRADQTFESSCTLRGVTSESTGSMDGMKRGSTVVDDGNTCTDGLREVGNHQMRSNFFVPIQDISNPDENDVSTRGKQNFFPVKRPSAHLAKHGSTYSEPAPIQDSHVSTVVVSRPVAAKSTDAELSAPLNPVKTAHTPDLEAQQAGLAEIGGNWMPVHSRSEPALSQVLSSTQAVCTTSTAGMSLGHMRMASDPVLHDVLKGEKDTDQADYMDSPIPSVSPFVYLEKDGLDFRKGSHLQGNSVSKVSVSSLHSLKEGQEELVKMAQLVCREDIRDVELDDPEEIQYEEGIEVCEQGSLAKSIDGGKDESVQGSASVPASEVGDAEDTDLKKIEKRGKDVLHSEEYESGRESAESSTVCRKKQGHERNKSLTQKYLASIVGDETESTKLSSVEVSNSAGPQNKKGTEKMKKIISQLLPGASFQPVPPPFPAHEHYMLPAGESIAIVINEKEPTSIIAYTLSSYDYQTELFAIQNMLEGKAVVTQATRAAPQAPGRSKETSTEGKDAPPKSPVPLAPKTDGNGVTMRNHGKEKSSRPKSWAGSTNLRSAVGLKNVLEQEGAEAGFLSGKPSPFGSSENIAEDNTKMFMDSGSEFNDRDSSPASPMRSRRAQTSDRTKRFKALDDEIADTDSGDDLPGDKEDNENVRSEQQAESKKKEERKPTIDHHIKLQFQDNSAKFYCSVYFAEQFRRLRNIIFPEGEERYIRSVARCVLWRARGGKSGSSFSKSLDDRFVMKQMSRLELQSFVELGPHYFEYINKAIQEKRPTAMAKLLGVYRIGFKNSQTNTTMRQDLLVMENLFYKRKVNKVFDLKGSVRSRYVHTSGKEDVLMDENLLEMICDSPLFIRPHSKAILSKAIHNDTEFLAKHMVMDYSLLVGIDEANYELVVGIIDYIRTFTWDKKLESYVKSTGILGGQGKMPTVVSPEVYQNRFMEAMHRYFLMVPDKWTGFGTELD